MKSGQRRNDVLTNSFGLAAAALANEMMPWIDPLGALIISLYITVTWAITCRQNAKHLISVSAPPELLQKLTYLALKESDEVRYVDKVLGCVETLPLPLSLSLFVMASRLLFSLHYICHAGS